MNFSKHLSFETGPASPRTTAIGMAFAASVLLALMIFVAKIAYEIDSKGYRVHAEVIQFVAADGDMRSAVFRFTDAQGRVHTVTDSIKSSRETYKIGEKVRIVYSEDDPSVVWRDSVIWLYFAPAILGLMSLLFYGGAALVWHRRSHFQTDYEARRGRTIVTVVTNDGSIAQTTHSSVPVFRWTGVVLACLGVAAWLGALGLTLQGSSTDGRSLIINLSMMFFVMGSLLLLGAMALFRHSKFLRDLQ